MPEKEKTNSDNVALIIMVLMLCITCILMYVVNGEYALKLETLRGQISNGVYTPH